MQVQGMTAKQLLQELLDLQKERSDFDDLPVYVDIMDHESYEEEQTDINADKEYMVGVVGEGVLYSVVVPEGFTLEGNEQVSTGHYLLLQSAEDDEEEDDEEENDEEPIL